MSDRLHAPLRHPNRRGFLALGAGALLNGPLFASDEIVLGDIAARRRLLFGASIAEEALTNPAYGALYARQARIVTTDWALKFPILRPSAEIWNFGPADRLLAFARQNRLLFRGHTLIWNEGSPDWLKALSARETARVFDEHIERVAARYAGRVHSWDVVNEPFWHDHGAPGGFRRGPWFDALGPAYVERAFRRAAAVDRSATLVLNEAHAEHDDPVGRAIRKSLLRLVDTLLDAGVSLQAVGLQSHLRPGLPRNGAAFVDFLHRLAARKLDIYLTELDVDDGPFPDPIAERDAKVAQTYVDYLREVLAVPAIRMIVLWQLSDRYSWYRDPAIMRAMGRTRPPRPLPFDADLRPKAAVAALAAALEHHPI